MPGKMRGAKARSSVRKVAVRKPSIALKTAIKQVLNKASETKFVAENNATNVAIASTVSIPTNLEVTLPTLSQGVGDYQRIGNNVKPTSLRVKLAFHFLKADNMSTCEYEVNVVSFTSKSVKDGLLKANLTSNTLFRVGDGTTVDPNDRSNNIAYINGLPINTDEYTLQHHKKFIMRKNAGILSNASAAGAGAGSPYDGSGCTFKRVEFSLSPPELKYASELSTTPANYAPFMLIWATQVNADTTEDSNQIVVQSSYQMYYKDI